MVAPAIIGGIIGAAGSLFGGSKAAGAASDAAQAQVQAAREGIAAQERATAQLRQDLSPYTNFGAASLGPLASALGISAQPNYMQSPLQAPLQAPLQTGNYQQAPAPIGYDQTAPSSGQPLAIGQEAAKIQPRQLDPQSQAQLDHLLTQVRQKMGGLREGGLSSSDISNASGEVRGYLSMIQQLSPEAYDNLLNEVRQEAQQNVIRDELTGQGIPENIVQAQIDGLQTGNQAQPQQQQMPTFAPSPFNSRAERLMGGSENPLLQKAIGMQMDGSQILQNPLLRAMQDDMQRRIMANQAARGKLGSGGTLESLQNSLIPMALDFRNNEIAGLSGLGSGLEDMRQREIDQLFRASTLGQSSAAQQGAAGMNAASNIGNLQIGAGKAQAQGAYGKAQAQNYMLGGLIQGAQNLFNQPNYTPSAGYGNFNPTVGIFD